MWLPQKAGGVRVGALGWGPEGNVLSARPPPSGDDAAPPTHTNTLSSHTDTRKPVHTGILKQAHGRTPSHARIYTRHTQRHKHGLHRHCVQQLAPGHRGPHGDGVSRLGDWVLVTRGQLLQGRLRGRIKQPAHRLTARAAEAPLAGSVLTPSRDASSLLNKGRPACSIRPAPHKLCDFSCRCGKVDGEFPARSSQQAARIHGLHGPSRHPPPGEGSPHPSAEESTGRARPMWVVSRRSGILFPASFV